MERKIKFKFGEDEQRFEASIKEYEDFLKSRIWMDMVAFLSERVEDIDLNLEVEPVRSTINKLQGAVQECKALLMFPEAAFEFLKESAERKEEPNG